MLNLKKIEWLGTEWSPIPKDKKPKGQNENIASLRFIKEEVERLKTLSKTLSINDLYEATKIMNRTIRRAQELGKKIQGTQYIENFAENKKRTNEHVIPQNLLTDAYKENHISFEQMVSMPLVDLSEASDVLLLEAGLQNINSDWLYPFKRYKQAGIEENITLPSGKIIKFNKWSLKDHFRVYPIIKLWKIINNK